MPVTLLSLILTAPVADAAPVDLDHDADVVATALIHAPPERVGAWLADLRNQESVLGDCTRSWQHGSKHVGVGASAQVVYRIGLWRRKLVATISEQTDHRIIVEHPGDRGFFTTWTYEADGEGTRLELRTLLNLPGRPLNRYYVSTLQPRWQACYAAALTRVAEALDTDPAPDPPARGDEVPVPDTAPAMVPSDG